MSLERVNFLYTRNKNSSTCFFYITSIPLGSFSFVTSIEIKELLLQYIFPVLILHFPRFYITFFPVFDTHWPKQFHLLSSSFTCWKEIKLSKEIGSSYCTKKFLRMAFLATTLVIDFPFHEHSVTVTQYLHLISTIHCNV